MGECMGSNHYFALFNLPVEFNIDKTTLKNNLLSLQKTYHPDNNTNNDKSINSDLLNFAFHTLNNDDLRAIYLLELAGVPVNIDQTINDLGFLDLMMDSRILLAESDDSAIIQKTKAQLNDLHNTIANDFNVAYENKDWQMANDLALKLKFLAKLNDDFKETVMPDETGDDDLYV